MSEARYSLPRVEGEAVLVQADNGTLYLVGQPPRQIEHHLVNRQISDAVYLTQRISADASVAHGLAAVIAWEDAISIPVAHNGLLLRDLLYTLSMMHAHLRHLYFSVLPDYLPMDAIARYGGVQTELLRQRDAVAARPKSAWERHGFTNPFSGKEVDQLLEGRQGVVSVLSTLQKMMAAIGGKFPMVMSLVPGGVSVNVTERLVLRLRDAMAGLMPFLESRPMEDMELITRVYPQLKTMGRGKRDYLAVSSVGDVAGPDAALFPHGVALENRLEAFQSPLVESVETAFYRVPFRKDASQGILLPAPEKPGAYSWIKAPRYNGIPLQTGPVARLVITFLAGSRSHAAPVVDQIEAGLGISLEEFNSVAGRLLSCAGEVAPLARRTMESISALQPGQASVSSEMRGRDSGEGQGALEGPAGALRHLVSVNREHVEQYDIISASTWNGSSRDEKNRMGPIEDVLNGAGLDLGKPEDGLKASRIVQSFFFSTSDAVQ